MGIDIDLVILDFSMHKKGFSVQRCETAVRESLTKEFGNVPILFYAPQWVAQYIRGGHSIEIAGGGYDAARLVQQRIARVRQDCSNHIPQVLVASYNYHVRMAAKEAGSTNGVVVGLIKLSDYVNPYNIPPTAQIEWVGVPVRLKPTLVDDKPAPVVKIEEDFQPSAASNDNNASNHVENKAFSRSREMRASLLKAKIFNEKLTRDLLFDAVKPLADQRLQLSKLRRRLADETFPKSNVTDKSKWDTQVHFFVRLLVLSGSLFGGSGPIIHGPAADGTEVTAISPTVKDDAEAYLLQHVIKELGNVTEFEHCPLAHALLRCFDEKVDVFDLKDRIAFLISKFADKLTLSETGTYIYNGVTSKPTALHAVK